MEQVLITGATTGIGRAMALTLHARGMAVIALGRRADALADLAAQAPGIETLCCDVTDRAGLAAALSDRRIDVLVNNAGVMPAPGPFDRMDPADIDRTVGVNLTAVLWLTRLIVPEMRARDRGMSSLPVVGGARAGTELCRLCGGEGGAFGVCHRASGRGGGRRAARDGTGAGSGRDRALRRGAGPRYPRRDVCGGPVASAARMWPMRWSPR